MHRDKLIYEVKEEYARLAAGHSREDFIDDVSSQSAESYFEQLLQMVINGIEEGRFDRFMNGRQVMEAVANNRERWGILIPQ
ncbi:MAG: hypothetical protein FWE19_06195 [Oscillospiraceae bacterium]|nr:hypothetical protein [Oscillospiraceae bacterium]